MWTTRTRRQFLSTLSSAGVAGLIGAHNSLAEEGAPETTTVRLAKIAGICIAPQYVADELLRAEGFTDIRYVATDAGVPAALSLARGEVDFTANFNKVRGIQVNHKSAEKYVGDDKLDLLVLFPGGTGWEVHYDIS